MIAVITASDVRDQIAEYLDNCGERVDRETLNDMIDAYIETWGVRDIGDVPDAAWSEFLRRFV